MKNQLSPLGQFLQNKEDFRHQRLHGKTSITLITFAATLMNLYSQNHLSEVTVDQLLKFIALIIGEELPSSYPKTFSSLKALMNDFIIKHQTFDACPKGHVLYTGEHENAICCPVPTCKSQRTEAQKYQYIPLIPRLQQLFEIKKFAEEIQNHQPSEDGVMRDIYDSPIWKETFYDDSSPNFLNNPSAVMMFVSSDGFQPFHHCTKYSSYSIWAFQTQIANFPYHLREKLMLINGVAEGKFWYFLSLHFH